jgi:hypothetical protein
MVDRLDDVLASIGQHLVIDAAAGDVGASIAAIDRARARMQRRPLVAVAVIVAVLAGLVASVPPARRAVGGWLHAGRIDVSVDPNVTIDAGLPAFIDAVTPVDPTAAPAILGRTPPDLTSSSLGAPTGWWTVPEGGVVLTWNDSETSLWVVPTGPDLQGHVDKLIDESMSASATWLPDLGNGGLAIDSPHLMVTPHRTVLAGAVVAWDEGGLTYRLESPLDVDELVEIARSFASSP